MFTRGIAVFVAAIVLLTSSPVLAQSSDLLASAERAALTMALGQDQSVVRRRRSGGAGVVGAVLTGVGIYLALRPPDCELIGEPQGDIAYTDDFWWGIRRTKYDFDYSSTRLRGKCTVQANEALTVRYEYNDDVNDPFEDGTQRRTYYSIDESVVYPFTPNDHKTREVTANKTMNQIGWATAAAGGVLLAWGLRGVDVPVRLDVAPTGGFRVSHSVGW